MSGLTKAPGAIARRVRTDGPGRLLRFGARLLYYRWLFRASRLPGATRLRRIVEGWEQAYDIRDRPQTAAELDEQFRSGAWRGLDDLEELSRFSIVAGYVRHFRPGGAVLDVGCGAGTMARRLGDAYGHYFGIDLSAEAVRQARDQATPRARFEQADALTFETGERFDVILWSESLFTFSDDPLTQLRHYRRFLKPDGLFVITMYESRRGRAIWDVVARAMGALDRVELRSAGGLRWRCGVFDPWSLS